LRTLDAPRCHTIHASDLAEARDLLANERFDVVLTDLGLPDSQGPETVEAIVHAARGVPVVVLSGSDDAPHGRAFLRKGEITPGDLARALGALRLKAGLRVLIVEDNLLNQKLTKTILTVHGFEVEVADSAEDALHMLDAAGAKLPDIILTDIQMPGMDGVTFAKVVKGRGDLHGIPVVALTAYAMRGDREHFLSQGLDGYISKPIDAQTFPEIVRSYATGKDADRFVDDGGGRSFD
jgi:CheY-like chemotaxis protein